MEKQWGPIQRPIGLILVETYQSTDHNRRSRSSSFVIISSIIERRFETIVFTCSHNFRKRTLIILSQQQSFKRERIMSTTTPRGPRAVTFSQFSELVFIPKDDKMECNKSYSTQERRRFRQELIREVQKLSRELNDTPTESITPEQLVRCVGIEVFVSKGLVRYVTEKKRAHVDAVLLEQSIQRKQCVCDIEMLSEVSRMRSQWARDRAGTLGTGYSKIVT